MRPRQPDRALRIASMPTSSSPDGGRWPVTRGAARWLAPGGQPSPGAHATSPPAVPGAPLPGAGHAWTRPLHRGRMLPPQAQHPFRVPSQTDHGLPPTRGMHHTVGSLMTLLEHVVDNWRVVLKYPLLAVALVVLGAVPAWFSRGVVVSNLESEVALLKSQLEAAGRAPQGPLPSYSLGGSAILFRSSPEWATPSTARRVELDWGRLEGIDVNAVLQIRSRGESSWVQGRILNVTDGAVVATSGRHSGDQLLRRFTLPRATGVKTYEVQIRGHRAGFFADLELRPPSAPSTRR